MAYSTEHIRTVFRTLPKELQRHIVSVDTFEILREIYERYNVPQTAREIIGSRTGRVLMGIIPRAQFANTLTRETRLDTETAQQVARDIGDAIFEPVKEHIRTQEQAYTEVAPEYGPSRPTRQDMAHAIRNTYGGNTSIRNVILNN